MRSNCADNQHAIRYLPPSSVVQINGSETRQHNLTIFNDGDCRYKGSIRSNRSDKRLSKKLRKVAFN